MKEDIEEIRRDKVQSGVVRSGHHDSMRGVNELG